MAPRIDEASREVGRIALGHWTAEKLWSRVERWVGEVRAGVVMIVGALGLLPVVIRPGGCHDISSSRTGEDSYWIELQVETKC
jgi:hypothetical protein